MLPDIQVNGDSLGVPGVAGIGENLVARVRTLEREVAQLKGFKVESSVILDERDKIKAELETTYDAAEAYHLKAIKWKDELDQAHAALKLALGALEKWKAYNQAEIPTTAGQQEEQGEQFTDAWFDADTAIEAIKACGVEL